MTDRVPVPHLSSDDIDAWLAGELPAGPRLHLEHCPDCRDRLEGEQEVVRQLAALAHFAPSGDFADQVMAQVRIAHPSTAPAVVPLHRRLLGNRRALAAAAMVAVVLVGAMTASIAWTLANRATLSAMGAWLSAEGTHLLWVTLRGVASTLIEQPWYETVRAWLATPGRAALTVGLAALAYLTGVLTLRRLMTAPTPQVADALA
jgi:hypothetical protein